MINYYEELPPEEQRKVTESIQSLYRQTFLLERRYDKKTKRYQVNREYYQCGKHMEFIKAYFAIMDIEVIENSQMGVIYIRGEQVIGEKLSKLTIPIVNAWMASMSQDGYAPKSISKCFRLLKHARNYAIAQEGMKNPWGANIGKVLREHYGDDIKIRARAMAAAGSDARMSGCEMPVIIVSGSGNQGITASVPVVVYARELGVSPTSLYRALIVSNLITIHQKTRIGRLSAYCGAVSAGAAAGAGIAYLDGGGYEEVIHTVVNALAIVSGMICDGAKASCAGKIAAAIDAGVLGYRMYQQGQQFYGGDGILSHGVEQTLDNVGRLGKIGMRSTDKEILQIMLQT